MPSGQQFNERLVLINDLIVKLENLFEFASVRLEGNLWNAFLGWYAENINYLRSQKDEIFLVATLNGFL